jgi:hypothetical protein
MLVLESRVSGDGDQLAERTRTYGNLCGERRDMTPDHPFFEPEGLGEVDMASMAQAKPETERVLRHGHLADVMRELLG